MLQPTAVCCVLGLSPETDTHISHAASLSPLPFSLPIPVLQGSRTPKDRPAPLWLIPLASFVWWAYFAFAFLFCYSQGRKGGREPMGRHQGRTDEPGRRGMPPTPAKSLEAGKTRVRRALLCGASSALPFLSLPGPAWRLLQSHCIFLLLHPSTPFLLLHPAWPSHRAHHVCCGKWQVSPMVMTTSWGWRSRRRGTSGISLISLTLLLMQLTSLLLLLSSGLGPKIQSIKS